MISDLLKYALRFLVLVLLQVLLLNNMYLSAYVNPYIYILFILVLPFEIPNWLLLILAFIMGITIDSFTNTMGMHASATVFLAFLRPSILKLIAPRDGYDSSQHPRVNSMGWTWFLTYIVVATVLHHVFLFFVEAYTFSNFFLTLLKALLSSIFTLFILILSELLVYNR